jgi:hypothetical protein
LSQLSLFDAPAPAHDPGGKVRTRLPPDVRGDAIFSPCERYRLRLRRWQGDTFPALHMLWIGMNPSTADASVNDPTIAREWEFTVREGYSGLVKVNVADYRATEPKMLLQPGLVPNSPENLPLIVEAAKSASMVVLCHGKLNRALTAAGAATAAALEAAGIQLYCLGTNADGSPRHPLYLAKHTLFIRYRRPS